MPVLKDKHGGIRVLSEQGAQRILGQDSGLCVGGSCRLPRFPALTHNTESHLPMVYKEQPK